MEYLALNPASQTYGKKSLLYSEMEILQILKSYANYKKLRKYELILKTKLKTYLKQLKNNVKNLEALIPEIQHKELLSKTPRLKIKSSKTYLSLEREIQEIKEKIAALNER